MMISVVDKYDDSQLLLEMRTSEFFALSLQASILMVSLGVTSLYA